jgi:predicted enzyme related to lactoylglutathione lyase
MRIFGTVPRMSETHGLTISIQVGDIPRALSFYTAIFGRAPDNVVGGDRPEWEICRDAWVQLVSGHSDNTAPSSRVRFEVTDINAEIARLRSLGIEVAEPTTLPEVAVFTDFTDPWGNRLGLAHDFAGPETSQPAAEA